MIFGYIKQEDNKKYQRLSSNNGAGGNNVLSEISSTSKSKSESNFSKQSSINSDNSFFEPYFPMQEDTGHVLTVSGLSRLSSGGNPNNVNPS